MVCDHVEAILEFVPIVSLMMEKAQLNLLYCSVQAMPLPYS